MNIYICYCSKKVHTTSVRRTLSMWSMLYLGGLGACPHRKFLQIWSIEIEFSSHFEQKMMSLCLCDTIIPTVCQYN